ncbi:MAG: DoxX family membrane protein [Bacteroidales bacterium]
MKESRNYTRLQLTTLVILRFLVGWHLFYEGLAKLLNPSWSSFGFLSESQWVLTGFSEWVISNPNILNVADFLNIWGLIFIGAGLILGIFTRFASFAGAFLLFIYFLTNPPLIGMEYTIPSEGSYLIVNKTLIEAVALFALAIFPAHMAFGLDALFKNIKYKRENK